LHTLLEGYVFDECYASNRNKYKYIAIIDQDESIAPRGLLANTIDLFKSDLKQDLLTNYQCYKSEDQEARLDAYLNNAIKNLNIKNEKASFHFKMSIHLKNKTTDIIFKEIGVFLNKIINETNNKSINYSILIEDPNDVSEYGARLKFYLTITNKEELEYTKRIYKFHNDIIEPIFKRNKQTLDKVASEIFNRVYILFGNASTGFLWGKTIHNTVSTNDFTVHSGGHYIEVPVEYGHLSHFRENYNLHWGESSKYSIYELMFDFNYYNCYFKPIIKEFGFNFNEY